jgi:hypothetical protein
MTSQLLTTGIPILTLTFKEIQMKKNEFVKTVGVTGALLAAMPVTAGTLTYPVVEDNMELEMTSKDSSSGGILVPLLLLGVAIAIISTRDDDPVYGPSDKRLKRNIKLAGTAENGPPIYRYQYL